MHLRVVAIPTLAVGKGKVANGNVAKPAKKDMDVKGNVQNEDKFNACHKACHEDCQEKQWA